MKIRGLKYDFSRILNWLIRPLNFTQNDMWATLDKNRNFNISKNLLCKVGIFQILFAVKQFSSAFSKDKLMIRLSLACRGRTAVRFRANSSHVCCVELVLKEVLCTRLGSRGSLRRRFSPLIDPTALLRDIAVRMCGLVSPCWHYLNVIFAYAIELSSIYFS